MLVFRGLPACIISISLPFGSFLAHGRPRKHHQLHMSLWITGQASSASALFAFWHLARRGKHHQRQLRLFFADCRRASSASVWNIIGSTCLCGQPAKHHQHQLFLLFSTWQAEAGIISILFADSGRASSASFCFLAHGRPRACSSWTARQASSASALFAFWHMARRGKHHQQLCCFSWTAGEHHQHQFAFWRMTGRENIICYACSSLSAGQASSASALFAFWRGRHHQH